MITNITGEQPFQVLTNNFSISPSSEGYTLQISADGINYSNLFQVGANVTRLVTGVAANSFYRLLGNNSNVSINWMRSCVTEGGGGGSTVSVNQILSAGTQIASITVDGNTTMLYAPEGGSSDILEPVSEFPESAETGAVVAKVSETSLIDWTFGVSPWSQSENPYNATYTTPGFHFADVLVDGEAIMLASWTDADNEEVVITGTYNAEAGNINLKVFVDGVEESEYAAWFYEEGSVGESLFIYNYLPQGFNSFAIFFQNDYDTEADEYLGVQFEFVATVMEGGEGVEEEVYYDEPLTDIVTFYGIGEGEPVIGVYQYDGAEWNLIKAGGGNVIELTQAEYDALVDKDPDALYIISDAVSINMDNYATTADTEAIAEDVADLQTAVAGKADAANVTPYSNRTLFPTWNSQGIITGVYTEARNQTVKVNGSIFRFYSSEGFNLPDIYSPQSAGTAGQPLLSNGSGAPVWGTYKFVFLTQTEYDALTTKDANTIYFITGA